ncbi:MAG TPA: TonB-dependent receptor [Candidatus Eisenbacteria bacterium]|nr:TonB-dependent receptor [Candidatus Eisenbacteria bacterium]
MGLRADSRSSFAPFARHAFHLILASFVLIAPSSVLAAASDDEPSPPPVPDAAPAATAADERPAADPRYRLDPVIVTAERSPLPLDRVPSDVTVLDGSRLDRERPLFMADALRTVPGIDVQRAGRLGKITDVRLRGADPRHTLVLFDGIPLNGPWVGSFDFADLGAGGFRQVEVMGGPASALYGSGAVGGVIQFLSGSAPGASTARGFAEFGGETTLRQGAVLTARGDDRDATLALSRLSSEGAGARDAYRGWNGVIRGEGAIGPGTRIRLSGLYTHGVKELPYDYVFDFTDFRSHQVTDPNYEERDRIAAGGALLTREFGRALSVDAELSGLSGRIVNDNAPNSPGGDFQDTKLDNTRWTGALRARAARGDAIRIVAGAEYRDDDVKRDDDAQFGGFATGPSYVEESIHTRAVYAQAHADFGRGLVADAGIRGEDHSLYGSYGVPRFSAAWSLPVGGLRLRAGYGRAFTAPTLTDLYYPGYGSPTLRPERSRTVEGGVDGRWLGGRLDARATWYRTRFVDLISSNSFFVADNVGRARIEGMEAAARVRVTPRLSVGARAASLPVAKDLETGHRLAKRPRWRTGADIDWDAGSALRLMGAWRWNGSFRDPFDFVDVNGRYLDGDTPGYAALDLGAVVTPRRWPVSLRVRVDNVLDRDIIEVKGLPSRGRILALGVDFSH